MLFKNRVRRYIDKINEVLNKKVKGNAGPYFLAIMFMIFFILLFRGMIDKERLYVTYDSVDDALVSSLIAATPINLYEFGYAKQTVVYDDVTEVPIVTPAPPGATTPTEAQRLAQEELKAQAYLTDLKLFSPTTDTALNDAYGAFLNSLMMNLKLDGSMNATISGIEGTVEITDFSVYNCWEYYDKKTGNLLHYRYIRYSYNGSTWSVYPYNIDTPVTVFNSFDDTYTTLDSTSVSANLKFTAKLTDGVSYIGVGAGSREINYQRIVDVTD